MSVDKTTSGPLGDLECLFTWNVKINDITDLESVPEKLLVRIECCPRRYHATYYNILAFVSHVHGNTNTALENLAKAEDVLKEEKRDEVDFLVTYSSFAWLYHHLGSLEDMETYLNKVKSIGEGRDIAVAAEKGWSFIILGAEFYQRAKECFEKALEANPDNVSYNAGYAIILSWLKRNLMEDDEMKPEDTLVTKQLQKALDLDPTDNEIMLLLAVQVQESNLLQSRELMYKALTKCIDIPELNKYCTIYFRNEGPTEESLKFLEKIKETIPNSYFPYELMGRWHWMNMMNLKMSYMHTNNSPQVKTAVTEAIHLFKKTVELAPSNMYVWLLLAEAYVENKQLDHAETIFTRLVSNSLHDADRQIFHNKYGKFLMFKKRNIAKAVEQFKRAYRINSNTRSGSNSRNRLLQIATWRTKERDDILTFLKEDDQDRQLTTALNTKMTIAVSHNILGLTRKKEKYHRANWKDET